MKAPILFVMGMLSLIYWGIALFVPARTVIIATDSISIAMSFTVFVVYGRRLWQSLMEKRPDVADFLIVGIAFAWLTNALDRSIRMISRVLHNATLIDNHFIGYLLLMLAFCASLHLAVRKDATMIGSIGHKTVSTEAWTFFTIALIGSGIIMTLALAADSNWFVIWKK